MKKSKFNSKDRIQSFKHAFNGFRILFKEEHNSRIHAFISLLTLLLAFYLKISVLEWIAILICFCLVFSFELINSSIENMADFTSLEKNPQIKRIKDLAAAAVLFSALISLTIGAIIFIPKIIELIINL